MKDVFNHGNIKLCSEHLAKHHPSFDRELFLEIATDNLEQRELKDRSNQIYLALVETLPNDYASALAILLSTLSPVTDNQDLTAVTTDETGVAGWLILPYTQYVGELGQAHLEKSMLALKEMTKRFSSEFGIRYFYLEQPSATLKVVSTWVDDPCHHVRRLVSEGCRPLLPWAMQLPEFKSNPDRIVDLLIALKDDESEYVRRSVANNINDIAKDHPDWVADLMADWLKSASKERQKLIKHGCRTLIKQGHKKVLSMYGYGDPSGFDSSLELSDHQIEMGQSLALTATISNNMSNESKVLLDYVVYHKKANGKLAPKVFKWKEFSLKPDASITLTKQHPFKLITTRKYYGGGHQIALQINGEVQSPKDFELRL